MRYKNCFDRIYFNGELLFERISTDDIQESRDFYCVTPLDLTMSLIKVMNDMNCEIKYLKSSLESLEEEVDA